MTPIITPALVRRYLLATGNDLRPSERRAFDERPDDYQRLVGIIGQRIGPGPAELCARLGMLAAAEMVREEAQGYEVKSTDEDGPREALLDVASKLIEEAGLALFARLMALVAGTEQETAAETEGEPAFHAPCSIPGCDHEEPPLEQGAQNSPRSDDGNAKTAGSHAREIDAATLIREARERAEEAPRGPWVRSMYEDGEPSEGPYGVHPGSRGAWVESNDITTKPSEEEPEGILVATAFSAPVAVFLCAARSDVPVLCDLAERQAAENARLKAERNEAKEAESWVRKQLETVSASLTEERNSLRASVELLDAEGRRMKAERDDARAGFERAHDDFQELLDVLGAIYGGDAVPGEVESASRRSRDAFEATEADRDAAQLELDAARAEIERRADPFPPGRGPETCGTYCARCGEKIHLVRPATGPDREERLENHCCPGGAS